MFKDKINSLLKEMDESGKENKLDNKAIEWLKKNNNQEITAMYVIGGSFYVSIRAKLNYNANMNTIDIDGNKVTMTLYIKDLEYINEDKIIVILKNNSKVTLSTLIF